MLGERGSFLWLVAFLYPAPLFPCLGQSGIMFVEVRVLCQASQQVWTTGAGGHTRL